MCRYKCPDSTQEVKRALAGNFGSLYLCQATAVARAVLHIPNSACSIFVCPNKVMAANAWDL